MLQVPVAPDERILLEHNWKKVVVSERSLVVPFQKQSALSVRTAPIICLFMKHVHERLFNHHHICWSIFTCIQPSCMQKKMCMETVRAPWIHSQTEAYTNGCQHHGCITNQLVFGNLLFKFRMRVQNIKLREQYMLLHHRVTGVRSFFCSKAQSD